MDPVLQQFVGKTLRDVEASYALFEGRVDVGLAACRAMHKTREEMASHYAVNLTLMNSQEFVKREKTLNRLKKRLAAAVAGGAK